METLSYEYNGKKYEFILSMKAKMKIEEAQKAKLKNPVVAKMAMRAKDGINNLTDDQLAEIIPYMDEMDDLDPVEVGFIVLSSYPPYREEVTREFFDGLVEDMDLKTGVEATFEFFSKLHESVFTRLAAMRENQTARQNLKIVK